MLKRVFHSSGDFIPQNISTVDLLLMYDDSIINEEDILFMWSPLSRQSPQLTPDGARLNFDALTEEQCFSLFRYNFKKIGYDISS